MYNQYLLIERWKRDSPPKAIRHLEPGTEIKLLSGKMDTVDHVGLYKVLLDYTGWVDWREIDISNKE